MVILYSKGIPGSRTIFGKKNHPLRRIFWICLTIVCCFLAFYQVSVMAVLFSLWSISSLGLFFHILSELLIDLRSFITISFALWLMLYVIKTLQYVRWKGVSSNTSRRTSSRRCRLLTTKRSFSLPLQCATDGIKPSSIYFNFLIQKEKYRFPFCCFGFN